MDKWIKKAEGIHNANFRMYGIGNFDISEEELAIILAYLSTDNFNKIKSFYEQLERERLG